MTERELNRLRRRELIDLILSQQAELERLREALPGQARPEAPAEAAPEKETLAEKRVRMGWRIRG